MKNSQRIKKLFAEIVAGVIPNKMARNRWRGILRYGFFRGLRLKHQMRVDTTIPKYYLTICAIAKNEGAYFKEWIEWHKQLGVEKFYIYDNESTDNTKQVLEPYIKLGFVDYTYFPGTRMQIPAYDDCLEKHRLDSHWIAVIDLDEFIVPQKDATIPDFLRKYEDFSAVEINWLIYGSGGAKEKSEGNVMDRFKYHSIPSHISNRHVKSILNPRRVYGFIGCHEVARMTEPKVDSHGQIITKNFRDRDPQQDIIRINHYAVKSFEEFLEKRSRGRARTLKKRNLDYFNHYDLNDIRDNQ